MLIFAVADDTDVLTGLRLSGIDGEFVNNKKEAEEVVARAETNSQIAVLLITESCAAMIPDKVKKMKLSSLTPLLVVIPGTKGSTREKDSITRLIREAIGIKI